MPRTSMRPAIWALLPVAALLVVHARSIGIGYLADDFQVLAAAADPAWGASAPFPAGGPGYRRPLTMASLVAVERVSGTMSPSRSTVRSRSAVAPARPGSSRGETPLAGESAKWHHAVNVLLHATNLVLLVSLLRAVGAGAALAAVAGAIFAVHPATVEPVAWISGRGDLLCAMFVLGGVLAFLRLVRVESDDAGAGTGGPGEDKGEREDKGEGGDEREGDGEAEGEGEGVSAGRGGGRTGSGGWKRSARRWVLATIVVLCGVGAVLAKETGLVLPVVLGGLWAAVAWGGSTMGGRQPGCRAGGRRVAGGSASAVDRDVSADLQGDGSRCDGRHGGRPLQPEGSIRSLQPEGSVRPPRPEGGIRPPRPEGSISPPQPEHAIRRPQPEGRVRPPQPEDGVRESPAEDGVPRSRAEHGVRPPGVENLGRRLRMEVGARAAVVASLVASGSFAVWAGWLAWQGSAMTTSFAALCRGAARVGLVVANALVLRVPAYSLRRWAQAEPWLVTVAAVAVGGAAAAIAIWSWRLGGARRLGLMVVLGVVVVAPLLPLLPFGWAAERHVYLPLALLLVCAVLALSPTGSLRSELPRSRTRMVSWCGAALAVAVAALGVARTGVWVENARLAAVWCQSFRALELEPSRPIVVAGYPALRGGAPVFSNDLGAALGFCRDRRLGSSVDLVAVGALELPASVADPGTAVSVSMDGNPVEPLVIELRADSGHFGRAPGARGERFAIGLPTRGGDAVAGDLVVTGVDSAGDLVAFRLELGSPHAAGVAEEPRLLSIGPGGFRSHP